MMHIRKTIVNLTAQNFDYLCNRMQGRTLGGGGGGECNTPAINRKLQKVGPRFIQNCEKSRSRQPVSRCLLYFVLKNKNIFDENKLIPTKRMLIHIYDRQTTHVNTLINKLSLEH